MKLCLFSSYYEGPNIPNYVKCYLEELKKHFDKVVLITNERELNSYNKEFITRLDIDLMMVENEGYDFGMWYKAFQKMNMDKYSQIGMINDSCILFSNLNNFFKWVKESNGHYCGMVNSKELGDHIQSYFLIVKKPAIPHVKDYFKKIGILDGDVRETINNYEIGICDYLKSKGLKLDSYLNCNNYSRSNLNVMMLHTMELVKDGLPLIKKKILLDSHREHERAYLLHHGFNFKYDFKKNLEDIMYVNNDNININYLLDI